MIMSIAAAFLLLMPGTVAFDGDSAQRTLTEVRAMIQLLEARKGATAAAPRGWKWL